MPLQATLLVLPLKLIKLVLSNGFFHNPSILTEIVAFSLPVPYKVMYFILKNSIQFGIYYLLTMCQVLSDTLGIE